MKKKKMAYNFPETNPFRAREALDLDFDIDKHNPELYVDLDSLREETIHTDYKKDLYFQLNIDPEKQELETVPADYNKVLLLGHRGSGKTTEIRRMHQWLHNPARYFAILIELEKELVTNTMKPEDYFIMMVVKLIRLLKEEGLEEATSKFDTLLEDWLKDEEVQKEVTYKSGLEGSAATKVDTDGNLLMRALSIFKFEADLKATLSRESKTTTTIRTKVKKDFLTFVSAFNAALDGVRNACREGNKGRDIVFLIDGVEKVTFDFYDEVFQKNSHILRDLDVNIVTTLRLDVFFKLEDKPNLDFFQHVLIPIVPSQGQAIPVLAEIVTKRLDKQTFFENGVLESLVEKSGGSLRQLLRLCSESLNISKGKRITEEVAQSAIGREGKRLYEALSPSQKEMLKNGSWDGNWSDPDVFEMVYASAVMKYNGDAAINPLIRHFFYG